MRAAGAGELTVVLTGATTGIGRATALGMAGSAARLILHGRERDEEVTELLDAVQASMRSGARLDYFSADYEDLGDVARLAGAIRTATDRVDLLINNAGRPGPPVRMLSGAGNEITFQTNYLAPVALVTGLTDLIGNASYGRIVNIASATHFSSRLRLDDLDLTEGYSGVEAYAHSKLALVTYTCWLAANRPWPTLEVVSMHPGVISTGLLHAMFGVGGDEPERAASHIRHVASLRGDNGAYYDERTRMAPHPEASDGALQVRLHDITSRLLRDQLPS